MPLFNNNTSYKFKKQDPDMCYNPEHKLTSFYQICGFKNPRTNKYPLRKLIFNEHGEIVKKYEKEYKEEILDKFMEKSRTNKYKIYPTYDLSLISEPKIDEILNSQSELLNNDYREYDYKNF